MWVIRTNNPSSFLSDNVCATLVQVDFGFPLLPQSPFLEGGREGVLYDLLVFSLARRENGGKIEEQEELGEWQQRGFEPIHCSKYAENVA